MTPEEFFMYLIIGLVVLAPIGARLYRRLTLNRTTQQLREQLNQSQSNQPTQAPPERPR
ncbi:MAG: hypothetical protein H8K09_04970 [Nitrospira sp.]|jgi:hypothetical protein|nr:hypothetical protein [Nitrospira sp.]ULA66042.1 MAG: hypothetical protein LZF62_50026 [Nitrospira sp.]